MKLAQNFNLLVLSLPFCLLPIACGDSEPDEPPAYECSEKVYEGEVMGGSSGSEPASCEEPEAPAEAIEIAGRYTDDFGSSHKITKTHWGSINFSYVNNEEHYAVGLNDESADWNPCTWSVVTWHEEDDRLYYCQGVFSAESECSAMDEKMPDTSDLDAGCSGYPWTELIED